MKKICTKCKVMKLLDDFHKSNKNKSGRKSWCKVCRSKDRRQRYLSNKEHELALSKLRYERTKRKKRDREKFRYATDIDYRLKCKLRKRLYVALKNDYKKGSAIKALGCNIEDLKKYLEDRFEAGMSWENYGRGGWHIDHVIPLDFFNLSNEEEFKKACHYTSLQPLWESVNIRKSNKL